MRGNQRANDKPMSAASISIDQYEQEINKIVYEDNALSISSQTTGERERSEANRFNLSELRQIKER